MIRVAIEWSLEGLEVLEDWREGIQRDYAKVSTDDDVV